MADSNSPIIDFFMGNGTDAQGRTLDEICHWPHQQLEAVHDYIQWLFPLPEPSAFNPSAPILTAADISLFKASDTSRKHLWIALITMLDFYGFTLDYDGQQPVISANPQFPERAKNWLTPGNHNFLRISRMLRSLALLGLKGHAIVWLSALEGLYGQNGEVIGTTTLGYWRDAVR